MYQIPEQRNFEHCIYIVGKSQFWGKNVDRRLDLFSIIFQLYGEGELQTFISLPP